MMPARLRSPRFPRTFDPVGRAALVLVTAALPASALQVPATSGLWRFDEGSPGASAVGAGTIVDSSTLQNDGTPAGSPTYVQSGVSSCFGANSAALSFNGGQEVQLSSMCPLHVPGDVTLEFSLRYTPSGHQSVFWTRLGDTDANRFNIFVNGNGTFGFDYRTPSGSLHKLVGGLNSGIALPSNVWTHLAIVRRGDVYELYRDGALVQSATDASPDLPTSVGWQMSGRGGYMLRADLDEVRFTDAALTPAEFLNACGGSVGLPYCFGVACPCGNDAPAAGCANSTGSGARLIGSGSASVAADDFVLSVTGLPPYKNVVILGALPGSPLPFGDGLYCIGGLVGVSGTPIGRADATGTYSITLPLQPALIGHTGSHQVWYRDPTGPCGSGHNHSNALAVTVVP